MSHEEFWSWLFQRAVGWLHMSPADAMACNMSDLLLGIEGVIELETLRAGGSAEAELPGITPEAMRVVG